MSDNEAARRIWFFLWLICLVSSFFGIVSSTAIWGITVISCVFQAAASVEKEIKNART